MPIQVQGPDGSIAQFPDGTSPDVIKSAMAKRFGGPTEPKGTNWNPASVVVDAVGKSWDKLASGVRDDYAASKARVDQPLTAKNVLNGEVDRFKRGARFVGDIVETVSAPGAALMHEYATGPAADALSKVVPIYESPKLGDVVDSFRTGKGAYPRRLSEDEARTKIEGDLNTAIGAVMPAKGGVGFAGPQVPQGLARRAKFAATADKPNVYAAGVEKFDAANVEPSIAAIRRGPATAVANAIAENPVAGGRVRKQMDRQISQVGAEAERIAGQYGTNRGRQFAGEAVREGVRAFEGGKLRPQDRPIATSASAPAKQSSFSAKAEKVYDDAFEPIQAAEERAVVRARQDFETQRGNLEQQRAAKIANDQAAYDAAVQERQRLTQLGAPVGPEPIAPKPPPEVTAPPQRAAVTPTQTLGALREVSQRVNGQQLSNLITDGKPRAILQALENDGANVRFNDLRELRTWVRNAQRDPELRRSISDAGLQRIEGALTADVYNNAERLGGAQALNKLRRADAYYRTGSERIKNALQAFDSAGSGEQAYDRVVQAASSKGGADIRKLARLKRSLAADDWGDVASTVLSSLGKPSAGAANAAEEGAFSIDRFLTGYANMSPLGREVLFGARGGGGAQAARLHRELENLAEVAGYVKDLKGGANNSKSAVAGQTLATMAGLVNPTTAIPTGLALGSGAGVGEILTNPRFVRMLAEITTASKTDPQRAAKMAERFNTLTGEGRPRLAAAIPTVVGDSTAVNQTLERR